MGPFATVIYGSQNRKTGSWYQDESWFLYNNHPWFHRGGGMHIGSGAGVDAFDRDSGHDFLLYSFRIVLSI